MRVTGGAQLNRLSREGRLTARPGEVINVQASGLIELKLESKCDGFIYVPAGYDVRKSAPLILMLHGAGGSAQHALPLLRSLADEAGTILLAPDSRRQTWDIIEGGYGPDVDFIDRVLEQTFIRYAVDTKHIAIAGFSDGASYALSLGVTNGDLFTHVIAFSPGFMVSSSRHGQPSLFISHGTEDRVLPIEVCSRKIVPQAKKVGYGVLYREFNGPHTVPGETASEAMEWFLKDLA